MKDALLHIFRSRITWLLIGLLIGQIFGHLQSQRQVEKCYNSTTPQALMSNCPRWLR